MRFDQLAAYSGQTGYGRERPVPFARLSAKKRFFVMAIT
jgi:hypothetical protein